MECPWCRRLIESRHQECIEKLYSSETYKWNKILEDMRRKPFGTSIVLNEDGTTHLKVKVPK